MASLADDKKTDLGFDPAALREKYLEERDRRLRPDGEAQYLAIGHEGFSEYLDDPYVEPGFTREAIVEEIDVAVVGGGFSGLVSAGWLRQKGVESIRLIERGGDVGGTWYWNRYPGAACDVEAYIYIPLLEEIGTVPTQKYVSGAEIWEHTRKMGEHFGVYASALLQTEVTEVRWNAESGRWFVSTNRGDTIKARFIVLGVGQVTRPKLPGIPGIETFKGPTFHTCRWDYGITGGDQSGNLSKLADKRVAIIGTGATAIQAIPHLGASAKQLYVFQRTPSAVDRRDNRPTDPDWARQLQKGWQKRRMDNFDSIIAGIPQDEDLVGDSWTDVWKNLLVLARDDGDNGVAARPPEEMRQLADYKKMDEVRRRVDEIVEDPETAAALKPWYNYFCKRPCFHDGYLQTYNRPNVKLVDTLGRGVDQITEDAVWFDGQKYEVDLIIYATGFEQNAPTYRAGNFKILGKNGQSLEDKWRDATQSLHGIMSHDFPNMFLVGVLSQAGGTVNFPNAMTQQCVHVSDVVSRCVREGITYVNVTKEAEDNWTKTMNEKAIDREQFLMECTPGYYNKEGKVERSFLNELFGGGAFEYFDILKDWRENCFAQETELQRG